MVEYYGEVLDTARDEIVVEFPPSKNKGKIIEEVISYMKVNMPYNKKRFEGQVIKVGKGNSDVVVWTTSKLHRPTVEAGLSTVYSGRF